MGTSGGLTTSTYAAEQPSDRGYIAWTMPITAALSTVVLSTSGTLYLNLIRRVPAGTITNITVLCGTAGSALTAGQCFATLFSAAGASLRTTVDQAANWASTGVKTMTLSSPYANAAGDYYVGMWFNGTTGPSFLRSINAPADATLTNAGLAAPNLQCARADTGLTTTPPGSFGAQTADTHYYWIALS